MCERAPGGRGGGAKQRESEGEGDIKQSEEAVKGASSVQVCSVPINPAATGACGQLRILCQADCSRLKCSRS